MRKPAAVVLSLFLTASAAFADTPKDSDPQTAQKPKAKPSAKAGQPATAEFAAQLEALRKALEAQQQQIQQLREELSKRDQQINEARSAAAAADAKASEASSKAAEAATSTAEAKSAASAVASDVSDLKLSRDSLMGAVQDTQKKVIATEGKIKGVGPFTFSGDVRLRYEPFFGGGAQTAAAPPDRHRQRFRLRFNVNAKLNDEISGGFSLASGNIGDPISTNQTEGDFFTRKPITIDKAFMTYKPKWFKPFSVTGGKYGYTWLRTELTWDNDLNPEGVSEQVMWDWKNGILSHFGVVAFQTPLFEIGGNNTTTTGKLAEDSAVFGGQIQTGWKAGSRTKLTADVAFYDYRNADRIARNQNNGNGFASSGTNTGLAGGSSAGTGTFDGNFGFGGSSNTNNVVNVVAGTPSTTTRFFASKFGILDAILRADFDTGNARWPVYTLFNYAQNTRACGNRDTIQDFVNSFPAGTTPAPTFTFNCDPHQRHAYWGEASLGRTAEKGDYRFAYTFIRVERDAVVAAFDFSDLRQSTNNINHRIEAYYQAYKNVTFGFTGLIGRQIVTAQSPTPERWLKRFQFDVAYKF